MLGRSLIRIANACIVFGLLCSSTAYAGDDSEYSLLLGFPSHLSRDYVSRLAFVGRRWTVTSLSEDRVVGYLYHRRIEDTLELRISDYQIVYRCDCVKLTRRVGRRPREMRRVDWTPVSWIDNLRRDMQPVLWSGDAPSEMDGVHAVEKGNRSSSIAERLETSSARLSQGLVSEEEYDAKWAELLSQP